MELIRDVRLYPWRRILAPSCMALSLWVALHVLPDGHGPRANAAIAIWLDTAFGISASLLSLHRLRTIERKRDIENGFQVSAIAAIAFFGTSLQVDAESGKSASLLELLLTDRAVVWSLIAIFGSLCFIVFERSPRSS